MSLFTKDKTVRMATTNLYAFQSDEENNSKRILNATNAAHADGIKKIIFPELCICGYSVQDGFFYEDRYEMSCFWFAYILKEAPRDIIYTVGMPFRHNGVLYNCTFDCLNGQIIIIRPKIDLAMDGIYREGRWFTRWNVANKLQDAVLPPLLRDQTKQSVVPIGHAIIKYKCGTTTGSEFCEELFTRKKPHYQLAEQHCDIICNSSGSHYEADKLKVRVGLLQNATEIHDIVYLYSNLSGFDGVDIVFDGGAMIWQNGKCLGQGTQFDYKDFEIVVANININPKRQSAASNSVQAAEDLIPLHYVDFSLCVESDDITQPKDVFYHSHDEEIGLGPALWLWGYLKVSGANGYFLPLSGGADSAATASIVKIMCDKVTECIQGGDASMLTDVRRIVDDQTFTPGSGCEIANRIFHTCYMGSCNSSDETRFRASKLASEIGAHHYQVLIDMIVGAFLFVFQSYIAVEKMRGKGPMFFNKEKPDDSSMTEDLALQNLQARIRMALGYFIAQLALSWRGRKRGFLLMLGSSNVEETHRGYMTKYDCSSADLNPIGGISKLDLAKFLRLAAEKYNMPILIRIVDAIPTAELRPHNLEIVQFGTTRDFVPIHLATLAEPLSVLQLGDLKSEGEQQVGATPSQQDEVDMGVSYPHIRLFAFNLMVNRYGPISMFREALRTGALNPPGRVLTPREVSVKVKHYFFYRALNMHKMWTLTPSPHVTRLSQDTKRWCQWPIVWNLMKMPEFDIIDAIVASLESEAASKSILAGGGGSSN